MTKITLKLGGLALVAALAACNTQPAPQGLTQSDGVALSETVAGDLSLTGAVLSEASAASMGVQSAAVGSLEANAQTWGLPRRAVRILQALDAYLPPRGSANCTVSLTPTSPADADGDGVPASATLAFDCNGVRPTGGSYATKGTVSLQDSDDAQENSGYQVGFTDFASTVSRTDGATVERTLSGSFSLNKTDPALYGIQKNYTHTLSLAKNGRTYAGSTQFSGTRTYAPDDVAKPWAAGTITLDKATPASLTWVRNGVSRSLIWYTDPTLHWNRLACQSAFRLLNFDSGVREFVYTAPDGAKSVLRTEFTGCGQMTATLNGQPVD